MKSNDAAHIDSLVEATFGEDVKGRILEQSRRITTDPFGDAAAVAIYGMQKRVWRRVLSEHLSEAG
ncbi:MAG: hypothetical protein AAF581_11130 [Planctomycetota bacterium]